MRISNDYYLIVDLEATCSDRGEIPHREMEIIEIGAVMQSSRTFEIEAEFQTCVFPVRHSDLTDFCTQLTGITQQEVDQAPPFADALAAFQQWMRPFPDALFCSWGDFDRNQFRQDCEHHGLDYPFPPEHMNIKAEFARSLNLRREVGFAKALHRLGMKFEGSHHRGLDDAKNIARIARRLCIGC
ncbi:MAG: exonuclease domain-containing protein [Planctomycetales bacterium]